MDYLRRCSTKRSHSHVEAATTGADSDAFDNESDSDLMGGSLPPPPRLKRANVRRSPGVEDAKDAEFPTGLRWPEPPKATINCWWPLTPIKTPVPAPPLQPIRSPLFASQGSITAPAPELLDWRHQYLHRGEWKPFRRSVNSKLNVCQRENKWTSARFSVNGETHVFDFLRMAEVNTATGKQRAIRWRNARTGVIYNPPVVWEHPEFQPEKQPPWQFPGTMHCMHMLGDSSPKYRELKGAFEASTPSSKVKNVVQCIHEVRSDFWRRRQQLYNLTRGQLKEARAEPVAEVQAWHGSTPEGITGILLSGFLLPPPENGRVLGHGVYFAVPTMPYMAAEYSDVDDTGLCHVLLCDLLLGNVEVATASMTGPSSNKYDNGVDNLEQPNRYIIWASNMTTHIVVRYVVSFVQEQVGEA